MFTEDKTKRKIAAKWLIGVVSACILIYLVIRHIGAVAYAVGWITDIIFPLLLGFGLAVILNVPMGMFESHWFPYTKKKWLMKLRRPVAIVLSIILVLGIFTGVAVLVVPELVNAITIVTKNLMGAIDYFAKLDAQGAIDKIPFAEYIDRLDIDWTSIKKDLETWVKDFSGKFMGSTIDFVGNFAGGVVNGVIGFVFAIYTLVNKENLKGDAVRLVRAWIPNKAGKNITHIFSVCSDILKKFISGQTTEAIILGSLCSLGMMILQLPYAPMIGALVGVTALIPVVGAFIGTIVGAFMIITVSPVKALIFIAFLLILQQIEGNLIYPRVVGASLNLPAMWVLAAVTVGGNIGGAIGMLLGVPAASAAYLLIKEATVKQEKKLAKEKGIVSDTPKADTNAEVNSDSDSDTSNKSE